MEKHFDPAAARKRWNHEWEAKRLFVPDDASKAEPFVIVLPPPNVTGVLHVGDIIVNWCPLDQTAISDEEVQYDERDSKLYWVRYAGEAGEVIVATTRPETILGDTAVAVNPHDLAKKHFIGTTCTVPLVNRTV